MWGLAAAVTVAAGGVSLVAGDAAAPGLDGLVQYGPLGLIVLGFVTGWIVPGNVSRQKDAEITRLQALFEQQVLPMAVQYAEVMSEVTRALERATTVVDRRTRGEPST